MACDASIKRCGWCGEDPLYIAYHDDEWGVPLHHDQRLFELLMLEGMQAGLSWITVLRKRQHLREAFADFNPEAMVSFSSVKIDRLRKNHNIIRNRLKIHAMINNAQCFLALQNHVSSFSEYCWQFVDGQPQQHRRKYLSQLPSQSAASQAMSKDLKHHGFKFVGPTICYAFMQASGMVNDHLTTCFRHAELSPT